jgi:hypothetical protein
LPETVEHSFDFVDLLVELSVLFGADIGQIASQKDLVLDLAGRASSQTQEVSQLAVFCAATSFGDIGWYGYSCSPKLDGQTKTLIPWEGAVFS